MGDRALPVRQRMHRAALLRAFPSALALGLASGVGVSGLAFPAAARAQGERDLRGSLIVEVLDAVTGEPIPGVIVRFSSETERSRSFLTDETGVLRVRLPSSTYDIILTGVAAGYETRAERTIRAQVLGYVLSTADAGSPQRLTFTLNRRVDEDRIRRQRELVRRDETSNVTNRDRQFFQIFPFGIGNNQSLSRLYRSIPGFTEDAINQTHVRGEHSITKATLFDGVLLPSYLAGNPSQVFDANIFSNIAARVAGVGAAYGGGSSFLDITLRQPTNFPAVEYNFQAGEYNTGQLQFGLSNTVLRPYQTLKRGPLRDVRYYVNYSLRNTDEVTEAPQNSMDNYKNYGYAQTVFGKIDFDFGPGRGISAILNVSDARNGVAARNGFNQNFDEVGGGFGFLGESSIFRQTQPLPSQRNLTQHFRQTDNNNLAMLQFKNQLRRGGNLQLAVGVTGTRQQFGNRNETIQVGQRNLPLNNSVEYLPFAVNDFTQTFVQGDFDMAQRGTHRVRAGFVAQEYTGNDSYRFFPQSQLALNALAALDQRLVAPGSFDNAPDSRGNRNYVLADKGEGAVPLFQTDKSGTYGAAYIEDTWRIRPWLRVNYGLRFDSFEQKTRFRSDRARNDASQRLFTAADGETSTISPRINYAIVLPRKLPFGIPLGFLTNQTTILRVSYNRFFTPPNLTQGDFVSRAQIANPNRDTQTAGPQITDAYDLSVERQVGPVGILKVGVYSKDMQDALTVNQLFSGLQAGLLATYSQGEGRASGFELSYESLPYLFEERGLSYFVTYNNGQTGPRNGRQRNNLGEQVLQNRYYFDQSQTLSGGIGYRLRSGISLGLSAVYGSGLYNSGFQRLDSGVLSNTAIYGRGERRDYNEINLGFSSGPRLLGGRASFNFGVENLADSRSRFNWRNGIGGTRYQMGRRILFGITGNL